jgi:uncharacterized OsmC-like protein
MSSEQIRDSIASVAKYFAEQPEKAISRDRAAVAVLQHDLVCKAMGPNGETVLSDMPKGIGGSASAPTPGWLLRAALANCDATVIAMRAAQLGVTLSTLEVTVDSESDDRGLLGMGDALPGPLAMHVRVLIGSASASPAQLREIVAWAEAHSPVGDALRRAIPSSTDVQIAAA